MHKIQRIKPRLCGCGGACVGRWVRVSVGVAVSVFGVKYNNNGVSRVEVDGRVSLFESSCYVQIEAQIDVKYKW